jgi:hypothetical protein
MAAGSWLAERRSAWEHRLARLADYLARTTSTRPRGQDRAASTDKPDDREKP